VNVYEKYILPRLVNLVMQNKAARTERVKFVTLASGTVVEVGIGSGLNIPYYGPKVERLYGLDPSLDLWKLARKRVGRAQFPVEFLAASGENIPLEDETVDAVVSTWTLCTIPDPVRALKEMKRVLKPEGQLVFVEHGRSPDPGVEAWQNRLNLAWSRIAGGCHLNRPIDDLIAGAGFRLVRIERAYVSGPRPLSYLYKGTARCLG